MMKAKPFITFIFFSGLLFIPVLNQFHKSEKRVAERGAVRLFFYNVENLFDTADDPLTDDDEFTPGGHKRWTINRFNAKLNAVFKVIAAAGESEPPDIIAFAEIENRFVLEQMVTATPLLKYNFTIVHNDSPDSRGIDVALVYRPEKLKQIRTEFIAVHLTGKSKRSTREILYMSFLLKHGDTVHLFINHWPSRSGGQLASEPDRITAALVLRSKTDSLMHLNACSKIVIMGDFNDEPGNKSIAQILHTAEPEENAGCNLLYNLSVPLMNSGQPGTLKYRGHWNMFDQVMVSGALLSGRGLHTNPADLDIFNPSFLLEDDDRYLGKQPNRTYIGYKYHGGFSDHLPVILDLRYGK